MKLKLKQVWNHFKEEIANQIRPSFVDQCGGPAIHVIHVKISIEVRKVIRDKVISIIFPGIYNETIS